MVDVVDFCSRLRGVCRTLDETEYYIDGYELEEETQKEFEELLDSVEGAAEHLRDFAEDCFNAAEAKCDPSDGPFLAQEPEEPDGFCDCPECCE